MVTCQQCQRPLAKEDMAASMSGGIMGDEYIESYYLCPACQVYTLEVWRDVFLGDDIVKCSGPLAREEGDRKVQLIKRCPRPWDKKCRCEAHREYFGDWLD